MTSRRRTQAGIAQDLSVAVIGAGNWGGSLVPALKSADLEPITVSGRNLRRSSLTARLLWICVPDGAIVSVAEKIVAQRGDLRGQIVLHSSGALPASVLEPARQAGAWIAAAHPVMSFPSRTVVDLHGVMFGIEARDAAVRRTLSVLVKRLGGIPFAVKAETKALYHAAGVMASPLLVAALAAAMETAEFAGMDAKTAGAWVRALSEATAANVFARGVEKSFSGPFARGDAGIIPLHLQALAEHPILADVYLSLARYAVERLPVKNRRTLKTALQAPLHLK